MKGVEFYLTSYKIAVVEKENEKNVKEEKNGNQHQNSNRRDEETNQRYEGQWREGETSQKSESKRKKLKLSHWHTLEELLTLINGYACPYEECFIRKLPSFS